MSDIYYAPCCGREIHDWSEADAGRCEECLVMDMKERGDLLRKIHAIWKTAAIHNELMSDIEKLLGIKVE